MNGENVNFSQERSTFLLHMLYALIDGIILGIFALNEFVLLKAFKGSSYQVGFLFQFTVLVLLFSVPLHELLRRTVRKKRMLRLLALATRLPLCILFFFPTHPEGSSQIYLWQFLFLSVFLIYYFANPLIMPTINGLLKANYRHEKFSLYYGYATTGNKIIMMLSTFIFGRLLDIYEYSFTYAYPFAAILGIASIFILTLIKVPQEKIKKDQSKSLVKVIQSTYYKSVKILKNNRPFRDFEIGFMLYGVAWLLTIAVIALFLEKELQVAYSEVSFYKNFYTMVSILLTPLFGKYLGRINPRKFSIFTFGFMFFYILFMLLTRYFPSYFYFFGFKIYYTLLLSYLSYGIFGAGMGLLWYIGSAYFAKDEDVADYQSIHLSLTGVRGAMAPLFGIFIYKQIGYQGVFLLGLIFLLLAIFGLIVSLQKDKS